VVSGKGGVGKSLVTGTLAVLMQRMGYKTAIIDADITGPSIPKMFGVHGPAEASDDGIEPLLTDNGIRLMSINLLLPDEESPVVWRGPVLANMVKQFWSEVMWGEVDYLLVDMPPGTGDVPLTVFQSLPVDGIVVVTSPQDLVKMIVKKALNMANMMNIPVLGLVENYSFIKCPDCGKEFAVFGKSTIDEVAAAVNLPVLGKLPIDLKLAELADSGEYAQANVEYLTAALDAVVKLEK
jgi:Mrp family chromosome partitioning ATPase